jgi:hypothetical protein
LAAALVILVGLGIYNSDAVSEFRAHSNNNPEYVFAFVEDCDSGLRDSGYAYAPAGSIMLKQVNRDGTVGEVCTD